MAAAEVTGVIHGLTGVDVKKIQDDIMKKARDFNWAAAWVAYKKANPGHKLEDSSIPTLCSELSQYQIEAIVENTLKIAKHEVARVVTEAVEPYLETLVEGGEALVEALGEAGSAVKGGLKKAVDISKKTLGALASRGQEFGDAIHDVAKKKKVNITLSSFEIFMLAQMGIFKAEGINTYRHISMGPMKNVQVYKVLYYIYSKNEPLLFVLYELYKKTKQEAFQKKLHDYEEKKKAYMKEVEKYEQEQRNAQEKYNRNMENYGKKLDNYKKCVDNPFIPRKVCDKEFKPHVPVLQTRKSPKKLSEATPILSNVGVNSGPKKSEKIKELSAAIKQNSASASQRRNRMSTRRRRS